MQHDGKTKTMSTNDNRFLPLKTIGRKRNKVVLSAKSREEVVGSLLPDASILCRAHVFWREAMETTKYDDLVQWLETRHGVVLGISCPRAHATARSGKGFQLDVPFGRQSRSTAAIQVKGPCMELTEEAEKGFVEVVHDRGLARAIEHLLDACPPGKRAAGSRSRVLTVDHDDFLTWLGAGGLTEEDGEATGRNLNATVGDLICVLALGLTHEHTVGDLLALTATFQGRELEDGDDSDDSDGDDEDTAASNGEEEDFGDDGAPYKGAVPMFVSVVGGPALIGQNSHAGGMVINCCCDDKDKEEESEDSKGGSRDYIFPAIYGQLALQARLFARDCMVIQGSRAEKPESSNEAFHAIDNEFDTVIAELGSVFKKFHGIRSIRLKNLLTPFIDLVEESRSSDGTALYNGPDENAENKYEIIIDKGNNIAVACIESLKAYLKWFAAIGGEKYENMGMMELLLAQKELADDMHFSEIRSTIDKL